MPNLARVQLVRKSVLVATSLLAFATMLVTHSVAENMPRLIIERTGWAAIAACILGRTWCALYIGGHKNKSVVQLGPYSIVRNPLYVFSVVGGFGIGLSSGSITFGFILGFMVFAVFHVVIGHEERFLVSKRGVDYHRYLAEVPRWLPNPLLWKDAEILKVSPQIVMRIFVDTLIFALAIPFFEVLERLQDAGVAPILMRLP